MKITMMFVIVFIIGALTSGLQHSNGGAMEKQEKEIVMEKPEGLETATFAGGCFWCVESDFEKVDGVVEVIAGYTGGHKDNPTYAEVSAGGTGHVEAVRILYDPQKVTYRELLDVFWRHVDPTDRGGQFVDRGSHYRAVIFYHNEEQRRLAEESKSEMGKSGRFNKPIVTEIVKFTRFYRAEDDHQDYHKTHSLRYKTYRRNPAGTNF